MNEPTPLFEELDGILFKARQIWQHDTTNQWGYGVGVWEWHQVAAVKDADQPNDYPAHVLPVCSLIWSGQEIVIQADFETVLAGFRRYKQRYDGQKIRLLAN